MGVWEKPGREKISFKIFGFLSPPYPLSLLSPETLSSLSPPASSLLRQLHRPARVPTWSSDHQLPTPTYQHRRTASETPGSAARSRANHHCRGKFRPPSCRADPPPAQDQLVELLGVPICVGGVFQEPRTKTRPYPSSTFFVRRPHSTAELPTAWGGFLELGRSLS